MHLRFLSLLALAVMLLALPNRAWAETGHEHCEEPAAVAIPTVPSMVTPPAATLGAPDLPCNDCPGSSCPDLRHCSASAAPCIGSDVPTGAMPADLRVAAVRASSAPACSFHPTPPTPPPDLVAL